MKQLLRPHTQQTHSSKDHFDRFYGQSGYYECRFRHNERDVAMYDYFFQSPERHS